MPLDLLTVGRVNLDLYAQQVGVPFAEVSGWDAMPGGCPANVAIAASRLGAETALFSAVGDDFVGEWIVRALERERVETAWIHRRTGPHSSLALRAQLAPDHPLAFYRHDPADIHLTLEEAKVLPLAELRALLVSADALARGSTAAAARWILEAAGDLLPTVYVDLDLRHVNWPSLEAYAAAVEPAIDFADVLIGTADEYAALLRLDGAEEKAIWGALAGRPQRAGQVRIVKHGDRGATVLLPEVLPVPPLAVEEASSVGAGDSFAAGLIVARLKGGDWPQAARFATACAAITVSRFGCSTGFPRREEVALLLERTSVAATG